MYRPLPFGVPTMQFSAAFLNVSSTFMFMRGLFKYAVYKNLAALSTSKVEKV